MMLKLRFVLVPFAAIGALGVAKAQNSPYYLGLSQSFTHESNVYRVPDDRGPGLRGPVSDTISTTSLLGGVDQTIGRQRVYGNATLSRNSFRDESTLDNNSYSLGVGLDWQTIERISGTVSLDMSRALSRYDYLGFDQNLLQADNQVKNLNFGSVVRVGVVTRLTAEAGYYHRRVDYSAPLYQFRDYRQNSVTAGLRYKFSDGLDAGAALRYTKGTYPHVPVSGGNPPQLAEDKTDRRDLDLTANWTPTGASIVRARVSLTSTDHSLGNASDFSGVTGSLTWDWRPTGKLRFVTSVSRDTGEDAGFLSTGSFDQLLSTSRISTALQTRATYELTSKIALDGQLRVVRRDIENERLQNGVPVRTAGSDRVNYYSLGARWAATRVFSFGCSVSRESRSGDRSVSYSYDDNLYGCYGQAMVRF